MIDQRFFELSINYLRLRREHSVIHRRDFFVRRKDLRCGFWNVFRRILRDILRGIRFLLRRGRVLFCYVGWRDLLGEVLLWGDFLRNIRGLGVFRGFLFRYIGVLRFLRDLLLRRFRLGMSL